MAETPKVALGCVPLRHGGVGQGVAEIGGEVEAAPLGDAEGVGHGLRIFGEEPLHLGRGLEVEVMVGKKRWEGHSSIVVLSPAATRASCSLLRSGTW